MKKKKTTKETEVARNVQLLTSRPKGMSYEDYREARAIKSTFFIEKMVISLLLLYQNQDFYNKTLKYRVL